MGKRERGVLFKCSGEYKDFEKACLQSWVLHFSMLRVKDLQTRALKAKLDERAKERDGDDAVFWSKVASSTKE
ncbi:hypothetical protein SeMB42_g02367 [Synchytrium endobioticum]|uniref:COX assembly mitochondrial protein n=1 Tax=Synchytrium endobioticum TaxID=286115 RepID=A0A507DFB4_9FUNG|nr:hypothetical protein SeMB42_g02367 [Synchytrium endobioticum]